MIEFIKRWLNLSSEPKEKLNELLTWSEVLKIARSHPSPDDAVCIVYKAKVEDYWEFIISFPKRSEYEEFKRTHHGEINLLTNGVKILTKEIDEQLEAHFGDFDLAVLF